MADADDTAVVGFAVWQRTFADQAGNYGMIERRPLHRLILRSMNLPDRGGPRAGFFLPGTKHQRQD